MKKRSLLLLTLICLASSVANAQFRFGVRAGANLTKANLDGTISELFKSETRPGFFLGPTLEYTIPGLGLGLDLSAYYENKSLNLERTSSESLSQTLHYLDVPLNVRWNISLGLIGVYAATGPQLAWKLGKDIDTILADGEYKFKKSAFSWNVGAGVNFGHLRVGYTYNIAIGNTVDLKSIKDTYGSVIDNAKLRNNTHQIHFTYFF